MLDDSNTPAQSNDQELSGREKAAEAARERFLEKIRQTLKTSAHKSYSQLSSFPLMRHVMQNEGTNRGQKEDDILATQRLRRDFADHLERICQDLRRLDIRRFVQYDLYLIRRDDADWIEREAENLGPLLEEEYPCWLQIVCDGHAGDHDWRAPGWLDKWPEDLSPKDTLAAARGGRLDTDRTAAVLKVVVDRMKQSLEQAKTSALKNVRIHIAHQKEANRQSDSRKLGTPAISDENQRTPPSKEIGGPKKEPGRKGYRAEIRSWMQSKDVNSVAQAATKLGVSESTLKSIMSDKGVRRYSEKTLKRVLRDIGHGRH